MPTIGEDFADELCRVFAARCSYVQLHPYHTNPEVEAIIERVSKSAASRETPHRFAWVRRFVDRLCRWTA